MRSSKVGANEISVFEIYNCRSIMRWITGSDNCKRGLNVGGYIAYAQGNIRGRQRIMISNISAQHVQNCWLITR
jgi:hypothetical protein